ncbi:ATPase AAA+ type core [Macrophomina phaseolina MS6]|uniref:Peroxisomal ATPase PEX6 n=1 Tax=Macrophomina phaseolina (strain MS6) TaxID=1126212 RepID=K2RG78_MACPH|nr:ATPase AAA+ type core [Macrophomina phaseolina MS6]
MAVDAVFNQRRRRRRRRRQDKPAISARLLPDERLKGEVGLLSEDLFHDLFPAAAHASESSDAASARVYHVAITPWVPSSVSSPESCSWTLLPVRPQDKSDQQTSPLPHSSLQFPAKSLSLQSFVHALHSAAPNRPPRRDAPIEIRILDAVPLGLDTIFVSIDADALRKLEDVKAKFGGGFGAQVKQLRPNGVQRKSQDPQEQERTWRDAVRKALQAPSIVHAGDLLPLPVDSHPITHQPAPPARVVSCEPVGQGLLLPSTRIVVLHSRNSKTAKLSQPTVPGPRPAGGATEDEDTSNETFYSAAEDRTSSDAPSPPTEDEASATDNLESELSGTDAGDLSDDSDDMISLSAPVLPPQSSGVLSAWTSATPRGGGFRTTGMMSPGAGSVYSSFTTTTARGGASGRLFKAVGLLEQIPEEMVHPKPGSDDDEEARIFVDTNTLVKVGCFSGDWVRIEAAEEPQGHGLGSWGLGNAFGGQDEEPVDFRAVKIFGLPESMVKKTTRYPVNKTHQRMSSVAMRASSTSTSHAYLSPILLANLGSPSHLRISALQLPVPPGIPKYSAQRPKITPSSLPPFAKEVTLLKLSTPLATDRFLQPSLFAGLKDYFEQKRRVVKSGDLVGIAVDEALGRAVYQGTSPEGDTGSEELLSKPRLDGPTDTSHDTAMGLKSVAWFKVGNVTSAVPNEDREHGELSDGIWGGTVSVDAANTKMVQAGSEQGKVPPATSNPWQYYLGAKRTPVSQNVSQSKPIGISDLPGPYVSPLRRRLRELILAATSPRAIHLGLPPLAVLITSNQRQIGKAAVAERACQDLGLHSFVIDSFDILTEGGSGGGDVKTEAFLKARAERALTCGAQYTALLLKHVEALDADRMIVAMKEVLADSRVLIATTTEVDKVPDGIRSLFTHELEMSAPDEAEREGILRGIVEDRGIRLAPDVDLSNIAVKTAALVAGDLVDVVDRALVAKNGRLEALVAAANKALPQDSPQITVQDLQLAGGSATSSLTTADWTAAVDAARKNFADAIGAPKIPNVQWSDVGGLTNVKEAVTETIQLPLSRPELFARGMKKRSGILFYGPPGTGKTLLAKAIATSFSLNFFSVKGPELLNMYIGESEANVRRVFQRARDARPCVVFFDELDSVAPKRGNQGDSGGVMDRIVSQLLAELDGMSDGDGGGGGVFVIGATNRPDLLDQALLRPGRFDKMLYLGVSDTHDKQQTILEALTRKFSLHPSLSLASIASTLPFTYTGADLYALCSDAMLKAITRQANAVDAKVRTVNAERAAQSKPPITTAYFFDHLATEEDTAVMVTEEDFLGAKRELVPSVSVDELRHYERVRKTFEGHAKDGKGQGQEGQAHAQGQMTIGQVAATAAQSGEKVPIGALRLDGVDGDVNGSGTRGKGKRKGKGKGKGKAAADADDDVDADEDGNDVEREAGDGENDEDQYVIRTDHLKTNGSAGVKGKGKAAAVDGDINGGAAFGAGAEGDEDMYQ